jgi:mannose-6-phosphate isomerase-like protein (cupin superfamily)
MGGALSRQKANALIPRERLDFVCTLSSASNQPPCCDTLLRMTPIHTKASVVRRNQSRGGEILNIYGDLLTIKLAGADTAGAYTVIEDRTRAGAGPPLHVHNREDESFYILEGEYLFVAAGERLLAGPGDYVFVPRGVPHTFRNIGKTESTALLILEPAGIEHFFVELAALEGPPSPETVAPVFVKYGLELLGPPLAAEQS